MAVRWTKEMRYERLNNVRRHHTQMEHGSSAPKEVRVGHLRKRAAWHRVSEEGSGEDGIYLGGKMAEATNER